MELLKKVWAYARAYYPPPYQRERERKKKANKNNPSSLHHQAGSVLLNHRGSILGDYLSLLSGVPPFYLFKTLLGFLKVLLPPLSRFPPWALS